MYGRGHFVNFVNLVDNIKVDLMETELRYMNWIPLAPE
jgi:hypothetical protein